MEEYLDELRRLVSERLKPSRDMLLAGNLKKREQGYHAGLLEGAKRAVEIMTEIVARSLEDEDE